MVAVFLKTFLKCLYVSVLCLHVCAPWTVLVPAEAKRGSPETGVTVVVNYHVGARSQTRVLCESSQGFYLPNRLCSPSPVFSIRSWPSWLRCGWARVSYFVDSFLWLVQGCFGDKSVTHVLSLHSLWWLTVITVGLTSAAVNLYHLNEMLLQVLHQKLLFFSLQRLRHSWATFTSSTWLPGWINYHDGCQLVIFQFYPSLQVLWLEEDFLSFFLSSFVSVSVRLVDFI